MKPEIVALRVLVDFVTEIDPNWFGRVDHGCSEEEVARFEESLGFPIPRAVREHFLLMGRTATFLSGLDLEWCGRLDQAVEINSRPELNPELGDDALYLGSELITGSGYFVAPLSTDDPPLYFEGHEHPLAERFSFVLLWDAFAVLHVWTSTLVLSGFLARRVSPERFAEIVRLAIASGFDRAFDSGGDRPCLQRGREFLQMHYWPCVALGCVAVAVGGVEEHVHALVGLKTDVDVARLTRELKAGSSAFMHGEIGVERFGWQEGYGAFTLRDTELDTARRYVRDQPRHHADGTALDDWERSTPPRTR